MPPDDLHRPRIDIAFLLNNNAVSFTQSARRHRIGRARVVSVLGMHPYVEIVQRDRSRLLWVGTDWTGRLLEVIAVKEGPRLIVIHAMDARTKVMRLYARGVEHGTT
jgi:hypothetical protein